VSFLLLIPFKGGFLFTSVTSCLQWNSIQSSHWSASALFYSSLLFSLAAIVNGSQQILVLSRERNDSSQDDLEHDIKLVILIREKIRVCPIDALKNLYVYALQTPIMLLTFSVTTFLAGLSSVIFSPLAQTIAWGDDAKVRRATTPSGTT